MRNKNGYGSVVKLSGNRRQPYEVRVNTRMDDRNYPVYDVLGRFADRETALFELAQYNHNPYDVNAAKLTFTDVYNQWFNRKYNGIKKYSRSSIDCTKCAFNKCKPLHDMRLKDIRTLDMQQILDDYTLSHAYMEHIVNLLHQMYKYALEYDIIEKDYSSFIKITKADDDEAGVPFSKSEIKTLWKNVNTVPYCDTVLILIYTGWRISEFLGLKTDNVSLSEWTMEGGVKTAAGKNRIVPIHSGIQSLVQARYSPHSATFMHHQENYRPFTKTAYYKAFDEVLKNCKINESHTPHDCRHTFTSLLNSAGANDVCIDRLVGHASKTLTKRTYTHKDIVELRYAVELIQINPPE